MIAEPIPVSADEIAQRPNRLTDGAPGVRAGQAARGLGAAWLLAGILILTACGGGGAAGTGGGGNTGGGGTAQTPTSATKTLENSPDEARALAGSVVEQDSDVANANQSYKRINSRALGLVTTTTAGDGIMMKSVLAAATRLTKATQTLACGNLFVNGQTLESAGDFITGCTGTIEFTLPDALGGSGSSGSLPAGSVFSIRYVGLTITASQSGTTALNGAMTITVVQDLVTSLSGITGALRINAQALSGTAGGESFGPETFTLDLTFAGSSLSLAIDGQRITNLQTLFTDQNNFTISSGSAITPVGTGYVSVTFSNWQVVNGIPQVGATLSVTGANGSLATLQVTAADASSATVSVSITTQSGSGSYTVLVSFLGGVVTVI
ncbi:MAG: hypothetical protein R3E83_19660 [Burkholderiaceae bacterium]